MEAVAANLDALRRRGKTQSRRVALDDSAPPYSFAAWWAARLRVWKEGVDVHPVIELGDGLIGFGSDPARSDDCLRPAIATVTQIPVEEVPDPRLDLRLLAGEDPDDINREAWEELYHWAERRGLRINLHETVWPENERWIGIVETGAGPFSSHCLVMSLDRVTNCYALLFDPGCSVRPPPHKRRLTVSPNDLSFGLTFDPEPDRKDI